MKTADRLQSNDPEDDEVESCTAASEAPFLRPPARTAAVSGFLYAHWFNADAWAAASNWVTCVPTIGVFSRVLGAIYSSVAIELCFQKVI